MAAFAPDARRARTSVTLAAALSPGLVFAAADLERFDPRYHVPRSQVWEGSRGGQRGHVHLHAREQFDLGRIHRRPGQALCGRRGWYERALEEFEVAEACPRCAAIAERLLDGSGTACGEAASESQERRLPESNRWMVPEEIAQPCGSASDDEPRPQLVTPAAPSGLTERRPR